MQYIEVKNFGPVEDATVFVNQISLLIGEQASGKSTISKLIYFFRSLKEDLFSLVYNNFGSRDDLRREFIKAIQLKFSRYFGSTKHQSNFTLAFFYSDERYIILKLNAVKYLNVDFSHKFYMDIGDEVKALLEAIRSAPKSRNTYEMIALEQSKDKYLRQLKDIVDSLFHDNRGSLYIPAGRNITVSYPNQFKLSFYGDIAVENEKSIGNKNAEQTIDYHLLRDFMDMVEANNDEFRRYDFAGLIRDYNRVEKIDVKRKKKLNKVIALVELILKGKYKFDKWGEKIVYDSSNKRYVYLKNASSGQQEVIRILQDLFLILLRDESVFRVIEEPEAHLYPLAQKHLVEIVSIVSNATGSSIFITTHSPYVLSVFNNLVFANEVFSDKMNIDAVNTETASKYEFSKIDANKFSAYGLKNRDGWEFKSITSPESHLIGDNYLDDVSYQVGSEMNELFEQFKTNHESPRRRNR